MKTFSVVNRKGGTGKTTTAIELSYILATHYHKRVLLIDADSQANATAVLLPASESYCGDGLVAVLQGIEPHYENAILTTDIPGLDIIPSGEELDSLDMACTMGEETPDFGALDELCVALAEDDAYDVVVIDCPPYYSISCINAIAASDRIIIPSDVTAWSAAGMRRLVAQIDDVRKVNHDVSVSGCLVTQWRRSDVAQDASQYLRERGPVPVFDTVIRRTDKVPESGWARQSVQQWSPFSAASRDYRAWVAELVEKEGL